MKLFIFLDIEGVLVTLASLINKEQELVECKIKNEARKLAPHAIIQLNRLVEEFDAYFIISSTWRKIYTLNTLQNIFKEAGFKYPLNIIDVTPILPSGFRGDEINAWMRINKSFLSNIKTVKKYVILDDDSDFHGNQKEFHIRTLYMKNKIIKTGSDGYPIIEQPELLGLTKYKFREIKKLILGNKGHKL